METTTQIIAKSKTIGTWCKVQILELSTGMTQMLQDGKWVDYKVETTEKNILEIGKFFDDHEQADKYIKTNKSFKQLLKLVQKGGL